MSNLPARCKRHPVLAAVLAWLIVMTPVGMTAEAAFNLDHAYEPTKGLSFMPDGIVGMETAPTPQLPPTRASGRAVGPVMVIHKAPAAGGSVQARIAATWPGDDRKALCVVGRETGQTFNPNIKSPGGTYWGLWQADSNFRAAYGWGPSVEQQTQMAWRGFQARGWQPWPTARGC